MSEIKSSHIRSLLNIAGLTAFVLLVVSCARPADPRAPRDIAVPEKWHGHIGEQTGSPTQVLAAWWGQLHDPVLDRLIEEALNHNSDIQTVRSRVLEARARMYSERGGLFPVLNAGASGQTSHSEGLRDGRGSSSSERFGGSLDASWEIDLFKRQSKLYQASQQDYLQAQELYYSSQASLVAEVATAYTNLRAAELRLKAVEENIGLREETVQITEWKEHAGEGSALETQQSLSTLEQARAGVPSIYQNIAQIKNQIAVLLGKTTEDIGEWLPQGRELPSLPAKIVVGIPAETLKQRPDVRAAERAVEAARLRRDAANRRRYPTLGLSGSIGIEALEAGHIFNPDTLSSSLSGRLTAPIFDAGRIQEAIYIQSEQEEQSLISYERTVLSALAEVENALVAIQRSGERLTILKRAIQAAEEASTLASWRYESGDADLLVVLEAQRTLLSLREQEINTIADQLLSHIQLYKSLGGGWHALEEMSLQHHNQSDSDLTHEQS